MTQENLRLDDYYSTSDLALATALSLFYPLEVIDRTNPHKAQFSFKRGEGLGQLIEAFWPGGLTLVFRAGSKISPLLTAGTGKIGVRLSSHAVATALAQSIGVPITGTSANISDEDACRTAEEVSGIFGERLDLILDGGETRGKIGSTVLDVTVHPPRILREGMVSQSQLRKFIGP